MSGQHFTYDPGNIGQPFLAVHHRVEPLPRPTLEDYCDFDRGFDRLEAEHGSSIYTVLLCVHLAAIRILRTDPASLPLPSYDFDTDETVTTACLSRLWRLKRLTPSHYYDVRSWINPTGRSIEQQKARTSYTDWSWFEGCKYAVIAELYRMAGCWRDLDTDDRQYVTTQVASLLIAFDLGANLDRAVLDFMDRRRWPAPPRLTLYDALHTGWTGEGARPMLAEPEQPEPSPPITIVLNNYGADGPVIEHEPEPEPLSIREDTANWLDDRYKSHKARAIGFAIGATLASRFNQR